MEANFGPVVSVMFRHVVPKARADMASASPGAGGEAWWARSSLSAGSQVNIFSRHALAFDSPLDRPSINRFAGLSFTSGGCR